MFTNPVEYVLHLFSKKNNKEILQKRAKQFMRITAASKVCESQPTNEIFLYNS